MKKVAIIIQNLHGGGAERTAANLSILLKKNYDIHLIVFDGEEIKYPYGGMLHDLKVKPSKKILVKVFHVIRRVLKIKKIKKKYKIETSISFMDESNIVNVLSKRKEKVITSIRNQMSKATKRSKVSLTMMKIISHYSDVIVSLSKGVEKDLIANYNVSQEKIRTIYNPCDGKLLRNVANDKHGMFCQMADNSVTTMGRLTEQKGQWHLIRAFKKVLKVVPDATLYIFGEGSLEGDLRNLATQIGIEDNIKFMGFVEAPHTYIMKSKVFVFPSLYEGLGNVLLEAMACGTPCISTDCLSGPREIISPGTEVKERLDGIEMAKYGILVSTDGKGNFNAFDKLTISEEQIAEAIIAILTDKEVYEKYHQASLKRSTDFLPEVIFEEWKEII